MSEVPNPTPVETPDNKSDDPHQNSQYFFFFRSTSFFSFTPPLLFRETLPLQTQLCTSRPSSVPFRLSLQKVHLASVSVPPLRVEPHKLPVVLPDPISLTPLVTTYYPNSPSDLDLTLKRQGLFPKTELRFTLLFHRQFLYCTRLSYYLFRGDRQHTCLVPSSLSLSSTLRGPQQVTFLLPGVTTHLHHFSPV